MLDEVGHAIGIINQMKKKNKPNQKQAKQNCGNAVGRVDVKPHIRASDRIPTNKIIWHKLHQRKKLCMNTAQAIRRS